MRERERASDGLRVGESGCERETCCTRAAPRSTRLPSAAASFFTYNQSEQIKSLAHTVQREGVYHHLGMHIFVILAPCRMPLGMHCIGREKGNLNMGACMHVSRRLQVVLVKLGFVRHRTANPPKGLSIAKCATVGG
jgi:hypothetical protein